MANPPPPPPLPPSPPSSTPPAVPPPSVAPSIAPAVQVPLPEPVDTPLSPEDEREAEELSSLSPFEVLKKKETPAVPPSPISPAAAPAAPAPSAPLTPPAPAAPDRELLLKQAAQAESTPFVLPESLHALPSASGESTVLPSPSSLVPPPNPAAPPAPPEPSKSSPPVPTANPVTLPPPITPLPNLAKPVPATSSLLPTSLPKSVPPTRTEKPASLPGQEKGLLTPPKSSSSRIGIVAVVGLIIVLLLLSGGGYALALTGIRIPLLYPKVSGLSTKGTEVASTAAAWVKQRTSYQMNGDLSLQDQGGGNKPSLPTGNTTQTSTISTVHATTPSSEPYIVTPKSGAVIGRTNLKLDTNAEVLIYLAASGTVSDTQDADWRAYLPANTTTPLVEFSSANINKTLLYAALYPVPLTGILDAVKTETNYEKQTVNGKPAAHYKYGLDAGKLKVYLPSGATISQPAAEIVYLWNGGQPVSSILTGTLSYQGHTYQLKESENYLQWNGSSAATSTNPAIMKLTGTDGSGQAPSVVSVSDFIAQLGIANLQSVPNTLSSSTGTTIQPITPTGQTVTSVSSPLTTVPPLPAATPSDQAKQRDIQRLADLGDLQQALENYKAAKGSYPVTTTLQQTRSSQLLLNDLVPTYLTGLPVDPLPNTFWYEYQSDGKGYVLRSVAEDSTNSKAVKGKAYYYYQLTGGTPQQ